MTRPRLPYEVVVIAAGEISIIARFADSAQAIAFAARFANSSNATSSHATQVWRDLRNLKKAVCLWADGRPA